MPQETFFFRESKGGLYGCYHLPSGNARGAAVVLCHPYGHEYVQSHRAFRILAERLAAAGFPALRFDYRGTGDSGGEAELAELERWREDVRAATEWCRARSRRQRLCALGLRLGGSLVALESGRERAFDAVVLWDPIVSGRDYLAELETLERQFRQSLPGGASAVPDRDGEVLGFPYPPALRSALAGLTLSEARAQGTRAALWVQTGARSPDHPPALGCAREDRRLVAEPRIWMEDADKALVPTEAIGAIVEWLGQVYA
jgi:pimeloyl-ACP methyl ester carboxylesterase